MKPKTVITAILLIFVAISLAYLIVGEYGKSNQVPNTTEHNKSSRDLSESSSNKATSQLNHKVIAYYFHGRARCPSCLKIESYTKEAVNKNFENELKDGRLEWKAINIEEAENKHFVKGYQLYTKSVVIADILDGKQTRWKNLEQVWELLHDKETFLNYIHGEISAYLGEG